MEKAIGFVIVLLIALGVIVIGLTVVKRGKEGVESLHLDLPGLYDACKWWLDAGTQRYSVDAVEKIGLIENLKALEGSDAWSAVSNCYAALTDEDNQREGYYIAEKVQQPCEESCRTVVTAYELCRERCPESVRLDCFLAYLTGKELPSACGG